jgi:hypothetical protein
LKTNHYTVLGISIYASPEEIRRAFRRLAQIHHPDKSGAVESENKRFSEILTAYQVLSNPASRKKYNRQVFGDLFQDLRPDAEELMDKTNHFHHQVLQTDPFRYDESALSYHFHQLLQLALELQQSGELSPPQCCQMAEWLIPGLERLPAKKIKVSGMQLAGLAIDNPLLERKIKQLVKWLPIWGNRQLPVVAAVVVTILLVVILFFWLPA